MECFLNLALKAKIEERYKDYVKFLKLGSQNNDAECTYLLGIGCYNDHYGLKMEMKNIFDLFKNNKDHFKSITMVARMLKFGMGCETNIRKSNELGIKILNSNGNHLCKVLCYNLGIGIKDNKKAFEECLISAKKGEDDGQYNMGIFYQTGTGIEKNDIEAFKWYLKAAEQKNVEALAEVGRCFYHGNGVRRDYEKSLYFFKKYYIASGNLRYIKFAFNYRIKNIDEYNIDSLIDFELARYYYLSEETKYLSWYFYKKTKELKGIKKLVELEKGSFKTFVESHKNCLTLLCISKNCKNIPKDIFIMLAKYLWKLK
jgi:hypothetical protein